MAVQSALCYWYYKIVLPFWFNAILSTVALWSISKWINTHFAQNHMLEILKEVGAESMIYVCANEFILFLLNRLQVLPGNAFVLLVWRIVQTIIIVMVCFVVNRIIKKTPFKVALGK